MVKFGCKTVCLLPLGFHCSLVWFHNHCTYVIHLLVLWQIHISVLTNLTSIIMIQLVHPKRIYISAISCNTIVWLSKWWCPHLIFYYVSICWMFIVKHLALITQMSISSRVRVEYILIQQFSSQVVCTLCSIIFPWFISFTLVRFVSIARCSKKSSDSLHWFKMT